jgi:hypothetical protein
LDLILVILGDTSHIILQIIIYGWNDFINNTGSVPLNTLEPRARQNVILETGMLLSSLRRSRIAIVVKGHVEIPSDLQGIIRFGYNDHVKEIIPKLCQRLKEAGFNLEPHQIAEAAQ